MADQAEAQTPKEKDRPWGHIQGAPQWLRMVLLGEHPPFDWTKQREIWRSKSKKHRNNCRKTWPALRQTRLDSMGSLRSLSQAGASICAVLFTALIFALQLKPIGLNGDLVFVWSILMGLALIVLIRAAIMPPPHTLFTSHADPYKVCQPRPAERDPGVDKDETAMLRVLEDILRFNAIDQFLKRCLVIAGILASLATVILPIFVKLLQ